MGMLLKPDYNIVSLHHLIPPVSSIESNANNLENFEAALDKADREIYKINLETPNADPTSVITETILG